MVKKDKRGKLGTQKIEEGFGSLKLQAMKIDELVFQWRQNIKSLLGI